MKKTQYKSLSHKGLGRFSYVSLETPVIIVDSLSELGEKLMAKQQALTRRHQLPIGECPYCDEERKNNRTFHPPHDAGAHCESGKRSTCICDACF